jgi:hypothetical protein
VRRLLAAAILATSVAAAAQEPARPPVGRITAGPIAFTLPPGKWRVVVNKRSEAGSDYILLLRDSSSPGKLAGFAALLHERGAGGVGYPKHSICGGGNLRGSTERNEDFGEQACWGTTFASAKILQDILAGAGPLKERIDTGGRRIESEVVLRTTILFADRDHRLLFNVYDNPEGDGYEPIKRDKLDESPWHPSKLASNPDKAAYIRARLVWAVAAYDELKKSFAAAK